MTQWYYAKEGERFGPVEFAALRDLALRGEIRAGDLVWSEGMEDWAPARTIDGLLEGTPPSAAEPAEIRPPRRRYRERLEGRVPGMVIAGFVVSLASLVTCMLIGAPVGAVLCFSGLEEAKRRNAGHGLAVAGIVIGIAGTLFLVLAILFFFFALQGGVLPAD